jgi:hypothetical protein
LIVDGHQLLRSLSSDLVEAFNGGLRYIQNLHSGRGLGRSWEETFETDDQTAVEELLTASGANFEWRDNGHLRIERTRPSTLTDRLGRDVWFNQADQWHWSNLDEETAASLRELFPDEDDLPLHVTFSSGEPIPVDWLDEIRETASKSCVGVGWEAGEVVVLDNVAWLHGRESYVGNRQLLVSMTDASALF